MEDDEPLSVGVVISMFVGAALLAILYALPYTLPKVESERRKRLVAVMRDRDFTQTRRTRRTHFPKP